MVKVSVEVRKGTARFRVGVQADGVLLDVHTSTDGLRPAGIFLQPRRKDRR